MHAARCTARQLQFQSGGTNSAAAVTAACVSNSLLPNGLELDKVIFLVPPFWIKQLPTAISPLRSLEMRVPV